MLSAIRLETQVLKGGRVEVSSPELPEGSQVEVIVMLPTQEVDATTHLLSTEANRRHIQYALEDWQDPNKRVRLELADLES
ncbi:hypothetical protein D5125_01800 [Magnetovirga frankeli]|nr:hypothetical protein D5125_01800 [gamma proteobacterium SS-5]